MYAANTTARVTEIVDSVPVNATDGLSPDELAVIFGPDKYKEELWPLILAVVKKVSVHPTLRAEINKLFNNINLQENNDVRRNELKTALKTLQDKVIEINLKNKNRPLDADGNAAGGRKRRKSKKRNYYKKRRTSKYR
jgi:hypothetical protein